MHRTANLETARWGKELALGVHVTPRKEVAQTDRRRRHEGKHGGSVDGRWHARTPCCRSSHAASTAPNPMGEVPGLFRQFSSMSCPRAGPVGSLFRSTLKNGSTFMPSGPMCTNRT